MKNLSILIILIIEVLGFSLMIMQRSNLGYSEPISVFPSVSFLFGGNE